MKILLTIAQAVVTGSLVGFSLTARAQSPPLIKAVAVHGDSIDSTPAPAVAPASNNIVVQTVGGVLSADFETLASYTFNVPDMTVSNHVSISQAEKQIPASIRKLDGKVVRIQGFMMPIKELQGKTTEFMIMRGQPSCCFSGAAGVNEFVTVEAPGKGFDTDMDDPVTILGTLHVGAIVDSGYIVGIYKMDADKMILPH